MHIGEALQRFVVQLEANGRSEHTSAQYRRHVGLLERWLAAEGESDALGGLDHEVLARFLVSPTVRVSRRGVPRKATSANALRTSLRAFFGYCHAAGWCERDPARLLRRARCGPPPPRGLSEGDQVRLLDALTLGQGEAARRDHMLFHLLLGTGVRLSAALGLELGDVDLERGELVLRRSKNGRVEVVAVSGEVRDHLAGYLAERGDGPLFQGPGGAALTRRQASRRLAEWLLKAGCRGKTPPHGPRHAFAMGVYGRTRDLLAVQAALGHRSVMSTVVYARVAGSHCGTR